VTTSDDIEKFRCNVVDPIKTLVPLDIGDTTESVHGYTTQGTALPDQHHTGFVRHSRMIPFYDSQQSKAIGYRCSWIVLPDQLKPEINQSLRKVLSQLLAKANGEPARQPLKAIFVTGDYAC
jgi:hypothetical protein